MKPSVFVFALLAYLGYLGYEVHDFYRGPDSDLARTQGQLTTLQRTITEKQKKVKESQEFYRTLDVKRAELQKLSETLMGMKATLSESVDIPSFMKTLLTEAQRIGLQVTSISPAPREKQVYYTEQPIDLSFSGVFIQLIAFLDRLSQATRIIQVDSISVKPGTIAAAKTARFQETTGTIRVKTFFYNVTQDDDAARNPGAPRAAAPKKPGAPVKK